MPGSNRIIILYRNHRALFSDDAVFDVIVTKRAILHFQFSANFIGEIQGRCWLSWLMSIASAPKHPFFSNFDQHYDFYQKLFFNICVKTLRHGPANRVGGTHSRVKSLCPLKVPFNLPALAAPILYSELFSERKLFHAFFWKAIMAPFELMNFSANLKTLTVSSCSSLRSALTPISFWTPVTPPHGPPGALGKVINTHNPIRNGESYARSNSCFWRISFSLSTGWSLSYDNLRIPEGLRMLFQKRCSVPFPF